jgi:hypothetical protein
MQVSKPHAVKKCAPPMPTLPNADSGNIAGARDLRLEMDLTLKVVLCVFGCFQTVHWHC